MERKDRPAEVKRQGKRAIQDGDDDNFRRRVMIQEVLQTFYTVLVSNAVFRLPSKQSLPTVRPCWFTRSELYQATLARNTSLFDIAFSQIVTHAFSGSIFHYFDNLLAIQYLFNLYSYHCHANVHMHHCINNLIMTSTCIHQLVFSILFIYRPLMYFLQKSQTR